MSTNPNEDLIYLEKPDTAFLTKARITAWEDGKTFTTNWAAEHFFVWAELLHRLERHVSEKDSIPRGRVFAFRRAEMRRKRSLRRDDEPSAFFGCCINRSFHFFEVAAQLPPLFLIGIAV